MSTVRVVYRPESAVFWLFVVALGLSTVLMLLTEGQSLHETLAAQIALAPLWLGFIAFLVWLMLKFDPFRSVRAHPQVLAAGTALGGTTAMVLALHGNNALFGFWGAVLDPDTAARWSAALSAPFVEEAAKAVCAALVLVLSAQVFNRISHALLLGMFVGVGFDLMEDLVYASREAIASLDSDVEGAGLNLVMRAFTAVPAHWSYTALASVGVLALLPSFADRGTWSWARRLPVAAGLFGAASLMHFIWDAPGPEAGSAALGVLALKVLLNSVIFLVPVLLLLRCERAWVREQIATRTDLPFERTLLESLPTRRGRRRYLRQARRDDGRRARKRARAAQRDALDAIQRGGSEVQASEVQVSEIQADVEHADRVREGAHG